MKKALVYFKHKSIKEYWGGKNFTHNKMMIEIKDEEIEDIGIIADHKVFDIMDLLYPSANGSGFDVCYQYDIYKIDLNQYS